MCHHQRAVSVLTLVMVGTCALAHDGPELLGRVPGPISAVEVSGDLAYLVSPPGLVVADVSDPTAPRVVGEVTIAGRARAVAAADGVAYVAATGGLRVVDVSSPSAPVEVAFVDLGDDAKDVAMAGGFAYAVTDTSLHVVDVSMPTAPVEVGSVVTQQTNWAVAVSDGYAYVVGVGLIDRGFRIFDVSTPSEPTLVGRFRTRYSPVDIAAAGSWVYLAETWVLRVVDASNPAAPTESGSLDLSPGNHIDSVAVLGSYLYLTENGRLRVLDVSTPSAPVEVGRAWVGGTTRVSVSYGRVVAAGSGGLHVVDVCEPAAPVVVGSVEALRAFDVALSSSYGYVVAGGFGWSWGGLAAVDLSTPSRPIEVGFVEMGGEAAGSRAVAVSDGNAYVLHVACLPWTCYTSLVVFDVSNPSMPWDVGAAETSSGVDVAVAGALAYVAASEEGLRVVDVSRPSAPVEVGLVDTPGTATGVAVSGRYAFVADGEAGLRVVDVSTPSAPVEVGFLDTPGHAVAVAAMGGYAYVADREAGLRIVDLSAPRAPVEVGYVDTPGEAVAVALSGGTAYVADGEAGLQVVDVSDPAAPVVVGSFDTGGLASGVAVSGGLVLLGSGDAGLYVFRERTPAPPPDPRELFIPAAALAAGAEGAFFQTDLEVASTGAEETEVVIQWLPRGEDNLAPVESDPIVLAPGHLVHYENVLGGLFGHGPGSVGALRVVADSDAVIGMSRTFNAPYGQSGGTFGQGMPAIRATEMITGTDPRRIVFLSETPAFRANVGCVNGRSEPVTISVGVFDIGGSFLGLKAMDLGPYSNAQVNRVLGDWAPISGYVDVWADREDALYACYGSVLDNLTSDPTTVLPR